ncbi:unnamed protein product [Paramecium sonneborni]|uniref:Uncharacterized protein n=1 Tax=Paramecium sonneborni TaxID=65129 RepID=A0A8S1L4N0_9CILI|nr:unnamed protein product [Paramecium sonneborni]
MSVLNAKAEENLSEKINKLNLPPVYSIIVEKEEPKRKRTIQNRTNRCKSQFIIEKYNTIQPNQSQVKITINDQITQVHQKKENYSVCLSSLINKTQDLCELNTNEIIYINYLIDQKKEEVARQNKLHLKKISEIRKNYEMKAQIKDKLRQQRKQTNQSADLYEKCWDQTIKEINYEIEDNNFLIFDKINQENLNKKSEPKPLKSQVIKKIRKQEDQFFRQCSDSILRQLKQKSIHLVNQVNDQIVQAYKIQKKQQYQRSKEREESKQEIIKSLRFKEQEKLIKILQSKPKNIYLSQQKKNKEKEDQLSSFKIKEKKRIIYLNNCLPQIDKSQEIQINSVKQQRILIIKKIQESSNLLNKNLFKISRNFQQQQYHDFNIIIK